MKRNFPLAFFFFVFACTGSTFGQTTNQFRLPPSTQIDFRWLGDSIGQGYEPHSAMLVPVKLNGCPKQFYMQFDLGAPHSLFYKNKLQGIARRFPKTGLPDSALLHNFSFRTGTSTVTATGIVVKQFDSTGIDWGKNSIEIIGTIGVDFIDGRVAVINYPDRHLTITDSLTMKNPARPMTAFQYQAKRILLPATVAGKETFLYFDTGSSMYELLIDKQSAEAIAIPGGTAISAEVNSWGRTLTAHSLPANDSISIAGSSLPVRYVTYIEGTSNSQVSQMMKMGIGGMTGNKLFLEYKLVIDTRNKQFTLIR